MKFFPVLILPFALLSCEGEKSSDASSGDTTSAGASNRTVSNRDLSSKADVIIETSMGSISVDLFEKDAPITVENFLNYVDQGHYDGTIFHRVMSNFMIQGGGFVQDGDFAKERETGKGIKNESPDGRSNLLGTLAMARTNNPNSATTQFFINVVDNGPTLDYPNNGGHGYAVFGAVIEGMDVVEKIKQVKVASRPLLSLDQNGRFRSGSHQNVPVEPVIIKSIKRAGSSE